MALRRGFGEAGRPQRKFPDMDDRELIGALNDVEDGLRERELEFVDDMGRAMGKDLTLNLTVNQRRWAEDIWERVR